MSRARAYARLLRTPKQNTWYGDLDPRSWRVVAAQTRAQGLGPSDLRRAAAVVHEVRSSGRYLSTLPRSGTNWLAAMLDCGLSLHHGGTGAFVLVPGRSIAGDDEWAFEGPRFGWPAQPQSLAAAVTHDRGEPTGEELFAYSHDPLEVGLVDYRRARPVVTLRDPLDVARSLVRKEGLDWHRAGPTRLRYSVGRVERFFSVWEQRLADPATAERSLVLRYEDLRADPAAALVQIGHHWDLSVDDAIWSEAAERCSWQAMADAAGDRRETARISLDRIDLPDDIDREIQAHVDGVGTSFGYPRHRGT